jgi:sugar/nucleoside kinase (ribokinase family)
VFVQTNLAEHDAHHANQLAAELFARLEPETVVITLGRLGALGRTSAGAFHVEAPQVPIRHTHGAGAAFSGGLAHAYLTGAATREATEAACRTGTAHCAATSQIPHQRTDTNLIKETLP